MEENKTTNQNEEKVEAVFSWNFPEYIQYKKNVWWYISSVIIVALLVWWQIIDNNFMFAIFLVLFYLVVLLYENREPEQISFAITAIGVKFGRKFFPYREFLNFFIIYQEKGIKNLYLDFRNSVRGRLIVPLDGQNAVAVRDYLLKYVKEDLDRDEEPFSEQLRRWLKL